MLSPELERRVPTRLLRCLLELTPDAMIVLDSGQRVLFANEQVGRLFGYQHDELVGLPINQLILDRFPDGQVADGQSMRSTRSTELIGVRKGGEEFIAEINVGSVEVDEGVLTINVVRDATEPKAVLRALAQSEERLRVAARIAGDLISESDVETGEVTWYGDVDSALGYEPGEFPRTIEGWISHLHPDDRGRVAKLMARDVFGARRALALDCRVRTNGGDYRHWRIHGVPRSAEEVRARKFVGVSVDVTDQLQLEAETQLHREALAHVDRVGLLGELHVSLAHELNQPLTAILWSRS